jgi:hypothetical protein
MLHTLALQFLSSRLDVRYDGSGDDATTKWMEGAVLWVALSPVSERQIIMALRKGMQHDLLGTSSSSGSSASGGSSAIGGRIHVLSVPLEVADAVLQQHDDEDFSQNHEGEERQQPVSDSSFTHEAYLKQLHQRIVHWLKHRELLSPSQYEQYFLRKKTEQQQQLNDPTQCSSSSTSLGPNLIIIDNGTMLSTMFGDVLSNAFISSVRATLRNHGRMSHTTAASATTTTTTTTPTTTSDMSLIRGGHLATNSTTTTKTARIVNITNLLAIRVTSPDDGGLYQPSDEDNIMKGEKLRSEYSRLLRPWLGMGSGGGGGMEEETTTNNIVQMEEQCHYLSPSSTVPSMVYRCGLYELADGIVDVSPLESGYARDVLGRLSFVPTWSGKGWWGTSSGGGGGGAAARSSSTDSNHRGVCAPVKNDINGSSSSICVNYRCDDSGVRVMRLRSR